MSRRALEPADFPFLDYRRFTFSLGVEAGPAVWLAGNTGARFDAARGRMVVEGDLVAQARVAVDKMRRTLEAGGLGLGDVVRVGEYVAPAAVADLPRLAALRREIFGAAAPATSTIVVQSLLRPEALIEIEAVAARAAHGDIVYLPAVTGADPRRVYERAGELLRARGLGWAGVVKLVEFVTAEALARVAETDAIRAECLGGRPVALTRVVMPRLADPAATIQVELTVSTGTAGRVLFVTVNGDPGARDVVAQCRTVYARIEQLLAAAGAGLDAVVKTTEFVTPAGLAEYRKTADVRREVFTPPYPAATGVVCERLLHPGLLLVVEAVAVLG